MIVVDTSVWIDVLAHRRTPRALRCVELLETEQPVGLTDIIYNELLQSLHVDAEVALLDSRLRAFPILRLQGLDDLAPAARLYRDARRHGITIRKTLDCLIAAPCVRTGAPLLHADADFDRVASCSELRIYS